MIKKTPDDPDVIISVAAYEEAGENFSEAARQIGIPRSTIQHHVNISRERGGPSVAEKVEFPQFADDDISADEILDHMAKRFNQRHKHDKSLKWFKVGIQSDDPIGLVVVGDPHMGSNGCNIPLLRRDCEIMASTPGVYAINIGDTADNRGYGRLVALYAENDVSRQTERRLARWFLEDAGVPWILWLMGNHDNMHGEFSTYLKTLNAKILPMIDWQAKFRLCFPNRREIKIDAAHNHKGTSIYNRLHGQKRAALWNENADIYVAGHHHNSAITQEELDDGRYVTLARARGYKWIDDHAKVHGFRDNLHGASIMFVIDPKATNPVGLIHPFADIEEGADYLNWKRSQ